MSRDRCLLAVLGWTSLALAADVFPPFYRIETVAGTVRSGDGGPAIEAQLGSVQGIAADRQGNLYLADTDNHRVRKVSAAGILTTIAGTGEAGYGGDGGPATGARLNLPYGVAVDSAGAVYIADLGNNRVRRIAPDGNMTTVAGTGVKGSAGDGGPATAAQLFTPRNVALDSEGNLYISEFEGHRVRRVSAGRISTVAGTGTAGYRGDGGNGTAAQLNYPAGLAVDRNGTLYIADSQNNRIRQVTSAGVISTAVGNTTAVDAPHAVAVDGPGMIYAGGPAAVVYAFSTTGVRTVFAGSGARGFLGDGGAANKAGITDLRDLALDGNGNVYLADGVRVRRVDAAGVIRTVAGDGYLRAIGDNGSSMTAVLRRPSAVALDGSGNLYVADGGTQRVRQVSPSGVITTVAGTGVAGGGNDTAGTTAASAMLNSPMGVAVDSAGGILIADTNGHRVRKVGANRAIATVAGTGEAGAGPELQPAVKTALRSPRAVCADRSGTWFVVDTGNHRVLRVPVSGVVEVAAGNGSAGAAGDAGAARSAQLNQPAACVADSFGNLYIADSANHRIRKVSRAGTISTVAGTGEAGFTGDGAPAIEAKLRSPRGVLVDDAGNLWIADTGNHRIRQVTPNGTMFTIAGRDSAGFGGDGGAALDAWLNEPGGLVLDGAGAIYFADTNNDRIRRLAPEQDPATDPITGAGITVVNAASLRGGPVAPGELVVIRGIGLGPETGEAGGFDAAGVLGTRVGDSQVLFDGVAAPIFYAQAFQISLQVPYSVAGRQTAHVEVQYRGSTAATADVGVAAAAPALFDAVWNGDGSLNTAEAAAVRGGLLTFYGTGEGLTDGANVTGKAASSTLARPVLPVRLTIAGTSCEVVSASSVSGAAGLLQVTGKVPSSAAAGATQVKLWVGEAVSPEITIRVR